jgi:hypothetical protein
MTRTANDFTTGSRRRRQSVRFENGDSGDLHDQWNGIRAQPQRQVERSLPVRFTDSGEGLGRDRRRTAFRPNLFRFQIDRGRKLCPQFLGQRPLRGRGQLRSRVDILSLRGYRKGTVAVDPGRYSIESGRWPRSGMRGRRLQSEPAAATRSPRRRPEDLHQPCQ